LTTPPLSANGITPSRVPANRRRPLPSSRLAIASSSSRTARSSAAIEARSLSDSAGLLACTASWRARSSWVPTSASAFSWLRRRCSTRVALRSCCCSEASRWSICWARAMPEGLSAPRSSLFWPTSSCCTRARRCCCCSSPCRPWLYNPAVDMRRTVMIAPLAPHGGQQGLEHRVGGGDDLGRGLVGLLVAQQVGRLLLQVHAAHRFALGRHLGVDRGLRLVAQAGVAGLGAGARGQPGQAAGQRQGAALEQFALVE